MAKGLKFSHTTYTPLFDAVVEQVGLSGAAVYGSIWRFCQTNPKNPRCFASISSIAERAHVSEKTVRRYVSDLEDTGFILVISNPGERLQIYCPDLAAPPENLGQDDHISGQDDHISGQDDRGNRREDERKEKEKQSPADQTVEEILGEDVLSRSRKTKKRAVTLDEAAYKARVLAATIAGSVSATDIKNEVSTQLGLNIPKTKSGDAFLEWLLAEHREGRTVAAFAHWWRTEDWRGIDGKYPASLNQVETIWPQAFMKGDVHEPDEIKETKDGGLMW